MCMYFKLHLGSFVYRTRPDVCLEMIFDVIGLWTNVGEQSVF